MYVQYENDSHQNDFGVLDRWWMCIKLGKATTQDTTHAQVGDRACSDISIYLHYINLSQDLDSGK